jgi:hypothetical protein
VRLPIGLLLALIALALPLHAQDQPVRMRPELPLVFPLTVTGKHNTDVTVKYPVMVNPTAVIKPGMVLRVIYVLSQNADGSSDLAIAHEGTLEQSYARNAFGGGDSGDKMDPALAHEIEGYRRTVWQVPNNFILAMAQYPTDQMHLIYSPSGKDQGLQDERFYFFDGLFVGQPDGKLRVVAVEKRSYADQAGIKAGDEIVAVGGIPTQDDPATFASGYATAKKVANDNEAESYSMTIVRADKGDTATVAIPLPPKIKSGLMDGFFDKPDDKK